MKKWTQTRQIQDGGYRSSTCSLAVTMVPHVGSWRKFCDREINRYNPYLEHKSVLKANWFALHCGRQRVFNTHTGSRGVTFVRKNYPSFMLPCKIHNLVILINKFAQCNLCESNLNSFLLVPYVVFLDLDLCARLVRHRSPYWNLLLTADHSSAVAPNTLPEGQRRFFGKRSFPNEARLFSVSRSQWS